MLDSPLHLNPNGRLEESEFSRLVRTVRRRFWVIVACFAIATGVAVTMSVLADEEYTASAALLFRDPGLDQKLFGASFAADGDPDPERTTQTNLELTSLDTIAQRTQRRLPNYGGDVSKTVEVSQRGDSDVALVKATAGGPAAAAHLANTFAEEYIAFRREADRAKVQQAQELVEQQLSELDPDTTISGRLRKLEARAEDLRVLASLQTGNAEVVQRAAEPASPSAPKPVRNAIFGAVVGLLLGFGLALLLEQLDRRLKRPEDLSETLGIPLVGVVPKRKSISRQRAGGLSLTPAEAEAFRMLRANLRYFNVSRDIRSVLVTSAAPGDGKSTVSLHLAAAAAHSGDRVLLLETDLRNPHLAETLNISGFQGLTSVLAGGRDSLADVATTASASGWGASPRGATFDIVPAGPLPPNPTEMLESGRMRELLSGAERDYDLVVLDTPPISIVSDAVPLLTQVSGVVVVSALGRNTGDAVRRLGERLQHLGAPVLGVVANFATEGGEAYDQYGSGYGAAPAVQLEETVPRVEELAELNGAGGSRTLS
jgi:capsular exopolysaccharide synthesis family protein